MSEKVCSTERTHTTEEQVEAPMTDADRAYQVRRKFQEICDLLDQMHEWEIVYRLTMNDVGRWSFSCRFNKTVTL